MENFAIICTSSIKNDSITIYIKIVHYLKNFNRILL